MPGGGAHDHIGDAFRQRLSVIADGHVIYASTFDSCAPVVAPSEDGQPTAEPPACGPSWLAGCLILGAEWERPAPVRRAQARSPAPSGRR